MRKNAGNSTAANQDINEYLGLLSQYEEKNGKDYKPNADEISNVQFTADRLGVSAAKYAYWEKVATSYIDDSNLTDRELKVLVYQAAGAMTKEGDELKGGAANSSRQAAERRKTTGRLRSKLEQQRLAAGQNDTEEEDLEPQDASKLEVSAALNGVDAGGKLSDLGLSPQDQSIVQKLLDAQGRGNIEEKAKAALASLDSTFDGAYDAAVNEQQAKDQDLGVTDPEELGGTTGAVASTAEKHSKSKSKSKRKKNKNKNHR